ncbi:hypothetical protein Mpsy_0263 [Methanolobus psychrophilus R15]|nr:hypothetical protein Mpsy_0263 [Methanolobus psychrophilus R15]
MANYCPICGTELKFKEAEICPHCGVRIKASSSSTNYFTYTIVFGLVLLSLFTGIIIGSVDSPNDLYYDGETEYERILMPVTGAGQKIYLHNYHTAKDPTYDELIRFIMNDRTDTIIYKPDAFVCAEYAAKVHNNAEKAGIRAGYVSVTFYDEEIGHALNVFNTTDRGLIFIDSTGSPDNHAGNNYDSTVNLEKSAPYIRKPIFTARLAYEEPGIVKDYTIYW